MKREQPSFAVKLPPWTNDLRVKRSCIMLALAWMRDDLPALTKTAVRAKGADFWREMPGIGSRTFRDIERVVGGFR